MKKIRRGSKIVEIVKRKYRQLNKNDRNFKQNHNEMFENKPKEDNFILQTSALVEPSTSAQPEDPSSYQVQNNTFENCLKPATSLSFLMQLHNLRADLYMSDSSDENVSEAVESPIPSPDISRTSLSANITINNQNNNNQSTSLIKSSFVWGNGEFHDEIIESNTVDVHVESTSSDQQNRMRKRRQAFPNEWKKILRKTKRQHGEPYLSAKGVLKPGKTLRESECVGKCVHQCTSKFNEEERLMIFSTFWNIETVEQKRLYIVSLINRMKVQSTKREGSRKKLTNQYFLKKTGTTVRIRVCQKFFTATLNVSETFVRICFKKVFETNFVEGDKRGKHVPHNKKPEEIREHVRHHIKSFPRIPAPCELNHTDREYLGHNLNLTKMYRLYRMKCNSEQRDNVDLAYYRSVFKKDFNIGFQRPRRDICRKCLIFEEINVEDRRKEKNAHDEHLSKIVSARRHRNEGKRLAESGEIHFAEYDLKAIYNSHSSSEKLKQSATVYNFTALDFNPENQNVHCFYWHEGIARKGATEIGSCLYKYLESKADGKPITLMSDTCASQCRNMYISSLLLYCIEVFDIPVINQKYFEQGHSQMDTDNIHATIEQAKENISILNPTGFYKVIRKALQIYPNNIHEMEKDDFIDIKYLKNILIKNAKVDYRGVPVKWLNIRWLQYRKENTNHIYFKYNLDSQKFNKIKVIRRCKRPQSCHEIILLKKAYNGPLPVPTIAKNVVL